MAESGQYGVVMNKALISRSPDQSTAAFLTAGLRLAGCANGAPPVTSPVAPGGIVGAATSQAETVSLMNQYPGAGVCSPGGAMER